MTIARRLNLTNIAFLFASPLVTITLVIWYTFAEGLHISDLADFLFMLVLTGLAITAGYHRYYSHRSYACHPAIEGFYLLFGAAALQAPVLNWVSEHRDHHRYVDQDGDPYNIKKGFFWAHMGWTFYRNVEPRSFLNITDLNSNKFLLLQKRYHLLIGLVIGFGLPFIFGFIFDRPWGGLLWGGLVRLVVAHHFTFLINSAGHFFGNQPYTDKNTSRDSTMLAILTMGEGYHNFHHTFPGDFRNGARWYHWDPTKWWILGLNSLGLAWRLNRTPSERIVRARQNKEIGKANVV